MDLASVVLVFENRELFRVDMSRGLCESPYGPAGLEQPRGVFVPFSPSGSLIGAAIDHTPDLGSRFDSPFVLVQEWRIAGRRHPLVYQVPIVDPLSTDDAPYLYDAQTLWTVFSACRSHPVMAIIASDLFGSGTAWQFPGSERTDHGPATVCLVAAEWSVWGGAERNQVSDAFPLCLAGAHELLLQTLEQTLAKPMP